MNILDELTKYIANKMDLELGENLFYNSMPDSPNNAVVFQQIPFEDTAKGFAIPSQIDGACYIVSVTIRNESNTDAYEIGRNIYRWLYTDKEDISDADGLVKLSDTLTVATNMLGEPVWEKTDNNGRKYFTFKVRVFSHRII